MLDFNKTGLVIIIELEIIILCKNILWSRCPDRNTKGSHLLRPTCMEHPPMLVVKSVEYVLLAGDHEVDDYITKPGYLVNNIG